MSRILAFAAMLAGIMLAGSVYAWTGATTSSSDMSGTTTLSTTSPVNVAVVDKAGNLIRIYAPEGNRVLCRGDYLPVYDSNLKVPAAGLTPSSPWEAVQSPTYLFGRSFSGEYFTATTREFDNTLLGADVRNMKVIGQVRVDNLIGDTYADGTLVSGDISRGDIASKPNSQCQLQPLILPQG